MPTKRIRDLPLISPAEGLFIPVDPQSGSTGRIAIGPSSLPAVIGNTFAMQIGAATSFPKTRFTVAHYLPGVNWKRLLTIHLGQYVNIGARGYITVGFGTHYPISPSTVWFSVARYTSGAFGFHLGLKRGLIAPQLSDAMIVGDPSTGICELWVYGDYSSSYEYAIWHHANIAITPGPYTTSNSAPTGPDMLQWSAAPMGNTIAYGYIVAQSLSSSGGYMRWDNGVQVTWAIVGSGSFSSQTGNGTLGDPYRRSYTWAFPAGFAEAPIVQASLVTGSVGMTTIDVSSASSTSATVVAKYPISGIGFTAHLYAVGRWRT